MLDFTRILAEGEAHEKAGRLADAERLYRDLLTSTRGTRGVAERAATVNLARLCANDGREFEGLALAHAAATLASDAGEAWDLARARLQLAAAGAEVFERLTEYRDRFRDRHQHLLREVAASRPWPPVDAALIARNLVVACAWCTRVRAADGQWMPIRQFLPQEGERFSLSHGICAMCWEKSALEIEAYARAVRPS